MADWLLATGAPSVSIAIVTDAKLSFAGAYGAARSNPDEPATLDTRYKIASVSKVFTAAAVLMLAEKHKLGLDDKVGTWVPKARAAAQATIRQLLTHTSGLRDYYPQDFLRPEMAQPTTPSAIIAKWADRHSDFAPGNGWQYSNTGYVLAGMIVEKASGQSLFQFLTRNIFEPLQMTSAADADAAPPPPPAAAGHTRHGFGPVHEANGEGCGWMYASGGLAMTPSDLARWNISLLDQSLLAPASHKAMATQAVLANGARTEAGLGLQIRKDNGRLLLGHDGSISGFRAENRIWPDQRAAITVVTNNDWADPAELLARLAYVTVPPGPEEAQARNIFASLQAGSIDRSLFTDNGNHYLTDSAVAELKASLAPLGPARLFRHLGSQRRGGLVRRAWTIVCRDRALSAIGHTRPDGKIEQFLIQRAPD